MVLPGGFCGKINFLIMECSILRHDDEARNIVADDMQAENDMV